MPKHKPKFKSARPKFIPSRELPIIDDYGDVLVTFTLRFLDGGNAVVAAAYKALAEKQTAKAKLDAARVGTMSDAMKKAEEEKEAEANVRAFIDACVIDWVNTDEETDEPIPYDADTCYDFFMFDGNTEVFRQVMEFCQTKPGWIVPKDVAKN